RRAPLRRVPRRAKIIGLAIPFVALALAAAVAAPMRPLSRYVQRRLEKYYEDRFYGGKVGFSDQMRLGRMTRLFESDEIALRIRGPALHPRDTLLRGAVFDHYDRGDWSMTAIKGTSAVDVRKGRAEKAEQAETGAGRVFEVRRGSADSDRIFLPLSARGLATPNGKINLDGGGIPKRASALEAHYGFKVGARGAPPELPIAAPTPEDVAVPANLRAQLTKISDAFVEGATDAPTALARIEARLRRDYRHSLQSDHSKWRDPVLHFLVKDPIGHCEYFAASMALLARARGIPARVVTGYRVFERNDLLSTYVVRERDAHGWVEAYVDGEGWTTFDPTPGSSSAASEDERETSNVVEALSFAWDRVETWLADRSMGELIVAAVFGAGIFVFLRARAARRGTEAHDDPIKYSPPLEAFERLSHALARRGVARGVAETLEAYAARLSVEAPVDAAKEASARAADDAYPEASSLVLRYATLRY
ncbi:DUF3488 domain-containing protein, partial [bacterium]